MQTSGPSVLIVDDEPILRDAIAFDFTRKGFEVLSAANGRLAYEIALNRSVDLILSDVKMPGGDGIELLDRIRANSSKEVSVILLSAFAELNTEQALDRGAEALLPKPFDRKTLMQRAMRAVLPLEARWSDETLRGKDLPRLEIDMPADLAFGRGGVFIALTSLTFVPESRIALTLRLSASSNIECEVIVRWVRNASESGGPPGMGAEFCFVEASGRKRLIELIRKRRRIAFIPACAT